MQLLNSVPEDRALYQLKQLKGEKDASVILSTLRKEKSRETSYEDLTENNSLPQYEAQGRRQNLGLELEANYPKAYQAFNELTHRTLQNDDYRHLVEPINSQSSDNVQQRPFLSDLLYRQNHQHGPNHSTLPKNLCDPRLYDLDISQWTDVKIGNEAAARAISLYLETDHPLLGFFNPDFFLDDLINIEETHCSPLLVNALLYWAVVRFSPGHK